MGHQLARRLAGVAIIGLALGGAACGKASDESSGSQQASKPGIQVPANIKQKGAIDVGAFVPYAPYSFMQGGQVQGVEADMIRAVAAKMGVQARIHTMNFEAMIPSIVNGRNDLLIGPFADTAERQKQISFVDTSAVGMRAMVLKGNPKNVNPDEPCGLTGGEEAGSYQLTVLQSLAKKCARQGKPHVKVLTFTDPGTAFLSVVNGRTAFTLQDPAVAKYTAEQNKKLEVLPNTLKAAGDQYQGWILGKDNTQLQKAVVQAIDELAKDGTWQKLLQKAGLRELVLTPPLVNGKPFAGS